MSRGMFDDILVVPTSCLLMYMQIRTEVCILPALFAKLS